jgi:hypothetical protein
MPQRLKVVIGQNPPEIIDLSKILGDGGESIVAEWKNSALKIVKPEMLSSQRAQKYAAMVKRGSRLGPAIVWPQHTIRDVERIFVKTSQYDIIGLQMERVDISRYDTLSWLYNTDYRNDNQFQLKDYFSIFYELRGILKNIHDNGFVIGDFNANGILVLKRQFWDKSNEFKRLKIIDADSFEFDAYYCEVFTVSYLDHLLWPQVSKIGKSKVFTKESDYFAFAAMFFQTLTEIGVYEGYHPLYTAPRKRLAKAITVLHPDVEYPADALDLKSLPKDLIDYFYDIFTTSKRYLIDEAVLARTLGLQVVPVKPKTVQRKQSGISVDAIFENIGVILDYVVTSDSIVVLSNKDGRVFYSSLFGQIKTQKSITDYNSEYKYRLVDSGTIAMIPMLYADFSDVILIRVRAGKEVLRETVNTIANYKGEVVLAGDGQSAYFLATNRLYRRERDGLNKNLNKPTSKFTQLWGDRRNGRIVGNIRTVWRYDWFITDGLFTYDVELSPLGDNEYIVDSHVVFSQADTRTALILRFTEQKGVQYTRFDFVTFSSKSWHNRLLNFAAIEENLKNRSITYLDTDAVFYPGQNGLSRLDLSDNSVNVFSETKGYINGKSGVEFFGSGVLSFNNDSVTLLTI